MSEQRKKLYPKNIVAVQNKVYDCFKGFSADEKRLFIIATPLARVTSLFGNEPIYVSAEEFARESGVDIRTAYKTLEVATKRLFDRHFSYIDDDGGKTNVRWTWKTKYINGGAELYFTEDVLEVLRKFDKENPYTKYKKEIVLNLRKDYSLNLYHLGKKYENLGKFVILMDDLFAMFELPEKYRKRKDNLKSRVLEPSIAEINEKTELTLEYKNVKQGRSIIGFEFIVKAKPKPNIKRDANTPDMISPFVMTDNQRSSFSKKLANLSELGNRCPVGWSAERYAAKIAEDLLDPDKQNFYKPYLKKVGFKL